MQELQYLLQCNILLHVLLPLTFCFIDHPFLRSVILSSFVSTRSFFPSSKRCSLLPCVRNIIFPSTSPLLPILPVLIICILASSKLKSHPPFPLCLPRQANEHYINFDACNSISASSPSIRESSLTCSNLHFQNAHLF